MRLTKKYDDGSYGLEKVDCETEKKLGQLEDIEDELGIDLVTLFKLIDKGAYIKGYKEPIKHTNNLQLNNYGRAGWCLGNRSHNLWLKQYGEYFALTKEELEK